MRLRNTGGSIAALALTALVSISATARADGRIKKRAGNQQNRIAQGIQSGQLTARESARLEHKESAFHQETRDMRTLDGGKMTPRDKALVNQQQNRLSKQIYAQKHDAHTQDTGTA